MEPQIKFMNGWRDAYNPLKRVSYWIVALIAVAFMVVAECMSCLLYPVASMPYDLVNAFTKPNTKDALPQEVSKSILFKLYRFLFNARLKPGKHFAWVGASCVLLGIVAVATSAPTVVSYILVLPFAYLALWGVPAGIIHYFTGIRIYHLSVKYGMTDTEIKSFI